MDERSQKKHRFTEYRVDDDYKKKTSEKEHDYQYRLARNDSRERNDRDGSKYESSRREERDDRHRGRHSRSHRAPEHAYHDPDDEKIKHPHHRGSEVRKHVDSRSSKGGKMRGWDDDERETEREYSQRRSQTSDNREYRRHRDSSTQRYAPDTHAYHDNRSSVTNSNERSTLDTRQGSHRQSTSHRSRSRSISSSSSGSSSEYSRSRSRRQRSASPSTARRSRSREKSRRRTDRSSRDDDKKKRKGRDRSDSRERDRKRRKRKEKERKHKQDAEERRSVLTGKKIKLKVKKDKFDVVQDVNRENLLKFLNSTFE